MRRTTALVAATAAVLAAACAHTGPSTIQASRTEYNQALRRTEDEQLLLNLVRLRYRDRPLFLEASALSTQFTVGGEVGADSRWGPDVSPPFTLSGAVVLEERPTVTYTPLQGEDFVQRVLAPIPLETLALLDGSGWSLERVLRACVQSLNGVPNAPRADGPTPRTAPRFEEFVRAAELLRGLELAGRVSIGGDEGGAQVLRLGADAAELPEARELAELLGLDLDHGPFALSTGADEGALRVRTRSFMGLLYFLSQSVEAPPADVEAGRVTVTRDAEGEVFDWSRVTAGLMRIRSGAERPENAAVAVRHRGSWFYVDDSDLDSKSTFSMLGEIYSLQSGDTASLAPVLTLPVGG